MNRCTGHCCRCLTIPFSPEELRAAYSRWFDSLSGYMIYKCEIEPKDKKIYRDVWLIAPMLEYLGRFKESPRVAVNPTNSELIGKRGKGAHYYRCKLFDPRTKKCTIYEIRPRMCRDYPYGKKCNYGGCTWKKVKAKKETRKERAARMEQLLLSEKKIKNKGGSSGKKT